MQLGIKIGLENYRENLEKSEAKLCEVWFRLDWEPQYRDMFNFLKKNHIKTGLHFWEVCKNNIFPCIATKNKEVREESVSLMKKNIDIAGKYGFTYVNAHPDARRLFKLIFPEGRVILLDDITPEDEARKILLDSAKVLDEYAKKRNTQFILETGSRYVSREWWGADKSPVERENISSHDLEYLGKMGININIDIGHVMTECTSQDPSEITAYLKSRVSTMQENLKLIHLSTNCPPFNGLDSHTGFEDADYQKGTLPGLTDLKEILDLASRQNPDLMLIPEPETNHLENNDILRSLLESVLK